MAIDNQTVNSYMGLTRSIEQSQGAYLTANAEFKKAYEGYVNSFFHAEKFKAEVRTAVDLVLKKEPGFEDKLMALGLDDEQMSIATAAARRKMSEIKLRGALKEAGVSPDMQEKSIKQLFQFKQSKVIGDVLMERVAQGKDMQQELKAEEEKQNAKYRKAEAEEQARNKQEQVNYADLNIPDPDAAPDAQQVSKPKAAKAAVPATNAAPLPKLTALVTKGIIVDMKGTSKAHEPARIEVATAVQDALNELAKDPEKKAILWKWMKLDPEKDTPIVLVNEKGQIADRKQAVNATEIYQDIFNLTSDGKIGQSTYPQLMTTAGSSNVFATQGLARAVAGEKGVGHLGGKVNPFELQNYEGKDAHKLDARKAMEEFKAVLGKVKTQVESQSAEGKYTAAEDKAFKAVFVGVDGKAPLLDTANLTKDGIKALEKAVHLKADGVIGTDLMRAVAQMSIRTDMGITIDPSEIHDAVATNARPRSTPAVAKAPAAKGRDHS